MKHKHNLKLKLTAGHLSVSCAFCNKTVLAGQIDAECYPISAELCTDCLVRGGVVDTRAEDGRTVRRRRECGECGKRWSTRETR